MGLTRNLEEASLFRATSKMAIAVLARTWKPADMTLLPLEQANVEVTAFSGGILHPTLQVTGAICLAAALSIPGTVASKKEGTVPQISLNIWRIAHRQGHIDVEIVVRRDGDAGYRVERAGVARSARKLFEGQAFY